MDDFKMEDIRQTKKWGAYLQDCGWMVEKIGKVNVFIKKIPLTPFSMMKVQRFSGKLNLDGLKKIKKKYKIIYTVIEPMDKKVKGWKINTKPFLPTKTVVIDLKKNKKKLWGELSTNARRILSKENSVIKVVKLEGDLGRRRFYEAWKESGKTWVMNEKGFNKLLNVFNGEASLWVSESKSRLLSGIILLESKDTVNYFQTWTSKRGRGLRSHYHLVWWVILEYKKKGLRWFDFEGVLDKRWPQKKWVGFSEFKNKFGGKTVTYPGSFVKWF